MAKEKSSNFVVYKKYSKFNFTFDIEQKENGYRFIRNNEGKATVNIRLINDSDYLVINLQVIENNGITFDINIGNVIKNTKQYVHIAETYIDMFFSYAEKLKEDDSLEITVKPKGFNHLHKIVCNMFFVRKNYIYDSAVFEFALANEYVAMLKHKINTLVTQYNITSNL